MGADTACEATRLRIGILQSFTLIIENPKTLWCKVKGRSRGLGLQACTLELLVSCAVAYDDDDDVHGCNNKYPALLVDVSVI